jgi:hypothetical protein
MGNLAASPRGLTRSAIWQFLTQKKPINQRPAFALSRPASGI